MEQSAPKITPADGKLGVLLPGLGAVSTTFVAGTLLIRKGLGSPIGSLTQMGTIRLGRRTDERAPLIRDFVPLADLSDICFAAWDVFPDDAYAAALKAGVVASELLEKVRPELSAIKPMPAVFDPKFVRNLDGTHCKQARNKRELANLVEADIDAFQESSGAQRLVMVWCGSTETFHQPSRVHETIF